jgi:hypothetical protein
MSTPISAMITDAAVALSPGMVVRCSTAREGFQRSLDLRLDFADGLLQLLDHLQVLLKQEWMMGRDLAVQRLGQGFARSRQSLAAQRRALLGIGLAGYDRFEYPSPALAHHL